MFGQIILFELKYRLRRPAFYVYFAVFFIAALLAFANGALPLQDTQFYNSPAVIALYAGMVSIFMMLPCSAIMGTPLYRDIEHNTKDYYLSYPITPAGYFWGRFLGSFIFVLAIASSIFWGAWAGTLLGPSARFGPFHFNHYLYPFLTIVVPNVFFVSAFFFGLVAVFRNVKVIYSSGLLLFLGYVLSNFFLRNVQNTTVIYCWDPFAFTPLRLITNGWPVQQLNTSIIPVTGLLLVNRLIWTGMGALILLLTWSYFSFPRFFGVQTGKRRPRSSAEPVPAILVSHPSLDFGPLYTRKVFFNLTRIETLNIIRDNYFWLIIGAGMSFLGFLFYMGFRPYGVPNFPNSADFMRLYLDQFSYFLFFIIMFYTGETVHRERITRYAFINDALPPPDWLLSGAKLLSLLALGVLLAIAPVILGILVQTLKGYYHYNLPIYLGSFAFLNVPAFFEMVFFCYFIQVLVPNKFAGYGIGIIIWVLIGQSHDLGYFTYRPLQYGTIPYTFYNDMDMAGHMLRPALTFHLYWLLTGGCLVIVALLFYQRGVLRSLRERWRLARSRYSGHIRPLSAFFLTAALAAGGWIYYNLDVLNDYLTPYEQDERKAIAEKTMKHFQDMPMPVVTRLIQHIDLDPASRRAQSHSIVTLRNNTPTVIDTLLIDKEDLEDLALIVDNHILPYTCPLFYPRGKFNLLKPALDSSDYRLYILPKPLAPGDTTVLEVHSLTAFEGFEGEPTGRFMLHNGTAFNGGLPGLGYDANEELHNNDTRKKHGLKPFVPQRVAHNDPRGRSLLDLSPAAALSNIDLTISTAGDQWVVGPGRLEKEWVANDRHYFHYTSPGIYPIHVVFSARYARQTTILEDSVRLSVYYHPADSANIDRFMNAGKDLVSYCSRNFGPYRLGDLNIVEGSIFAPRMATFPGVAEFSQWFGWNMHLTEPEQTDYAYFNAADQLAMQWWGQQLAPAHTAGSPQLSQGIARYIAMVLMSKRYPGTPARFVVDDARGDYRWSRRRNGNTEAPLLDASERYLTDSKAALALHCLRGFIGEDSVNAALADLYRQFSLRDHPPYAGAEDLYAALHRHIPDSLQYFLSDSWQKVCLYDNKLLGAIADPSGKKLTLNMEIAKIYIDSAGKEHAAAGMNDYIDIGVYGEGNKLLYKQRRRMHEGVHTLAIPITGKPHRVVIDPEGLLIDRNPQDNEKIL